MHTSKPLGCQSHIHIASLSLSSTIHPLHHFLTSRAKGILQLRSTWMRGIVISLCHGSYPS